MDSKLNPTPTQEKGRLSKWRDSIWTIFKRALPFAGVLLIVFLSLYVYNQLNPAPLPPTQSDINLSVQQAMASATPAPAYSSRVYQMILPSVVFIQTDEEGSPIDEYGVGSGVIINDSGDILTAYHVVADKIDIEVFFIDGSQSRAEIIYAEPEMDIAVLKPEQPPEVIVPAVLGGNVQVGDEAYAVGNPLGLAASMSAGVISGFDRSIPIEETGQRLEGLIQFDTAVNPGNSGGPLLNRNGQVIGIVTALANPYDQNFFTGIGFAVPISSAVSVSGGGPEY